MLVPEEEGPDNQHEVVGVEGSGGGSVTKSRSSITEPEKVGIKLFE